MHLYQDVGNFTEATEDSGLYDGTLFFLYCARQLALQSQDPEGFSEPLNQNYNWRAVSLTCTAPTTLQNAHRTESC